MEDAIRKSKVLIEALPYIKKFFNKIIVIKYGGSSMDDAGMKNSILQDVVFMRYAGMKPVLVHGGGPNISERLKENYIETRFIDGLRVTCEKTMEVVDKVLTEINENLVKELSEHGGDAFGLSGKENNMIQTVPRSSEHDLGYVGTINAVDTTVLKRLIETNVIPVISPVGKGKDGKLYNVNADEAASNIALALKAEKFVLMTNVKGVMGNSEDPDSLYHSLRYDEINELIGRKVISGGMLPKINACLHALSGGVGKSHIVDASLPHALLLEIFTDKGIGTEIVK